MRAKFRKLNDRTDKKAISETTIQPYDSPHPSPSHLVAIRSSQRPAFHYRGVAERSNDGNSAILMRLAGELLRLARTKQRSHVHVAAPNNVSKRAHTWSDAQ